MPWWGWLLVLGVVGVAVFLLLKNREDVKSAAGLGSGDDATVMSPFTRLLTGLGVDENAASQAGGVIHTITGET